MARGIGKIMAGEGTTLSCLFALRPALGKS